MKRHFVSVKNGANKTYANIRVHSSYILTHEQIVESFDFQQTKEFVHNSVSVAAY